MLVLNGYLEVKELKDDLVEDGIIQKYDDNSPYIYARMINVDPKILEEFSAMEKEMAQPKTHTIILTRRISKIPVNGNYFVHKSDVIKLLTESEYNKLKGGN